MEPVANSSARGVRQTTEHGWAAWLKLKILPGTPLSKANLYRGQDNVDEITFPSLVVSCIIATEHIAYTGYYEADLDLIVSNTVDGGSDSADLQAAMVGQLESMLISGSPGDDDAQAAMAALITDAANKAGIHYTVIGYWVADQTGQMVERHWMDSIKLKVHCMASSDQAPAV